MYTTRFSFGSKAPSLFEIGHNLGLFALFFTFEGNFWGRSQVQKLFSNNPIQTINFGFESTALSFVYNTSIFGASFGLFWALGGFFGTFLGYFWGRSQVQKHFWNLIMQTINFCFGSIAISFCFKFGQILGLFTLFGSFGDIFGVGVRFKNFFGTCLHRLTTFILEVQLYLASLKLSRVGGGGGVVGHCDFNENQVVSF